MATISTKPSPHDDPLSDEELREMAQLLIHGEIPKRADEDFFEEDGEVDVYGASIPRSLIDQFLDDEL